MRHSGRDLVLGGMLLALAVVLPMAFHAAGLGSAFLPMFFPMILAGFLIAPPVAAAVGLLSPLTSALLTGMPPFFPPYAFIMMAEGIVLAGVPSFLRGKKGFPILPVLLVTLLGDRLVLLAAVTLASHLLELPAGVLGPAAVVHGLPGMALILAVLPPMVKGLELRIKRMPVME